MSSRARGRFGRGVASASFLRSSIPFTLVHLKSVMHRIITLLPIL